MEHTWYVLLNVKKGKKKNKLKSAQYLVHRHELGFQVKSTQAVAYRFGPSFSSNYLKMLFPNGTRFIALLTHRPLQDHFNFLSDRKSNTFTKTTHLQIIASNFYIALTHQQFGMTFFHIFLKKIFQMKLNESDFYRPFSLSLSFINDKIKPAEIRENKNYSALFMCYNALFSQNVK